MAPLETVQKLRNEPDSLHLTIVEIQILGMKSSFPVHGFDDSSRSEPVAHIG
jgi:hypothetical protein